MKFLKDRQYYENLYDRETIRIGWHEGGAIRDAREKFFANIEGADDEEKDKLIFWWERIYWWLVELPYLLPRWEGREAGIDALMLQDKRLDEHLEGARPRIEPVCTNCGKQGLRLALKQLLHKNGSDRAVLFMFDCGACKTRNAYWEDGSEWVPLILPCPACTEPLKMDVQSTGKLMTTTMNCAACGYTQVEEVDVTMPRAEVVDPNFERDKALFCLSDERARIMQEYRLKWQDAMYMMDEDMKRATNKDLYDMVAKIERFKIPQVMERLRADIEKAGYIELAFDKPELGGHVTISFGCMDNDSSREDTKSRKLLKRVVDAALNNSNWRLMSDGISYRLGYLSGRVRAYESEEELVGLLKDAKVSKR